MFEVSRSRVVISPSHLSCGLIELRILTQASPVSFCANRSHQVAHYMSNIGEFHGTYLSWGIRVSHFMKIDLHTVLMATTCLPVCESADRCCRTLNLL